MPSSSDPAPAGRGAAGPIRFKHLCAEDKAKLAKLIAKVASMHDGSASSSRPPLRPRKEGEQNRGDVGGGGDREGKLKVDNGRLLEELEGYKAKFQQSLTVVKEYQTQMLKMAETIKGLKAKIGEERKGLKADVEKLSSEVFGEGGGKGDDAAVVER